MPELTPEQALDQYEQQILEQADRITKYRLKGAATEARRIRVASTALDRAGKELRKAMNA